MTYRTWNEFWGGLLCVRFHQDNPERWTRRQAHARWLFQALSLSPQCRVLDLGCGDGLLDICLAREGARVVAVDRIAEVLDAARAEAGNAPVEFRLGDLREVEFGAGSFDVVLMLDVMGLMNDADEAALLGRAAGWLSPGGQLAVDLRTEPAVGGGETTRKREDGVLTMRWTYDPATRLQHIVPVFVTSAGESIGLRDPYGRGSAAEEGVLRYIHRPDEVRALLEGQGLLVRDTPAFGEGDRLLLVGQRP